MRRRRAVIVFIVGTIVLVLFGGSLPAIIQESTPPSSTTQDGEHVAENSSGQLNADTALKTLDTLAVKGRAPKTHYERSQFGAGWALVNGCSTRNIILYRDLKNPTLDGACAVTAGTLHDPYTGETIIFTKEKSASVQIDHVVALSDAWQKGAQQLTVEQRKQLANDPLELLAVSGSQNQSKSDGDAATWLPKNKAFRCEYVARQIAVKQKYSLWVTEPEKQVMSGILKECAGIQ